MAGGAFARLETLVCTRCAVRKPRAAFKSKKPYGVYPYCSACMRSRGSPKQARTKCQRCGETKPRERFPVRRDGRPDSKCLDCIAGNRRPQWTAEFCPNGHSRAENEAFRGSGRRYCRECSRVARRYRRFMERSERASNDIGPRTIDRIRRAAKTCVYCGDDVRGRAHIDHIHPLKRGGSHTRSNLVASCPTCNISKSAKLPVVVVVDDTNPTAVRIALIFEDGSTMGNAELLRSALAA